MFNREWKQAGVVIEENNLRIFIWASVCVYTFIFLNNVIKKHPYSFIRYAYATIFMAVVYGTGE